jgi:hypothetical protein
MHNQASRAISCWPASGSIDANLNGGAGLGRRAACHGVTLPPLDRLRLPMVGSKAPADYAAKLPQVRWGLNETIINTQGREVITPP